MNSLTFIHKNNIQYKIILCLFKYILLTQIIIKNIFLYLKVYHALSIKIKNL